MMGRVVTAEAQRFMVDCLKAVGTASKAAEQQAELLIQADRFGHPSHGLNRLEMYVNDIKSGACEPNNAPKVLKETEATAWVDANNVLGATASHFGMDLAIKKALKTGVGWVSVKGSNHFGMAGFWAQKAADQGLIGMAFTNTSPLLAPTRSKEAALGTNPIACVAPASQNESFYLDMATTTVSVGKIEMQRRKGEPLPSGWAQGPDGNETKDAELAFQTSCLMPLGGGELTSGYKGFGLAAMVELFSGILGGANYGHHVRSWSHSGAGGPANLGHCFVAVNPECFAPCFGDRLADSITHWRQMAPEALQTKTPRKRVANFTSIEKELLAQLIKKRPIVECKLTDGKSVAKKQAAWDAITQEFNSNANEYKTDPKLPVLAPGDKEKQAAAETGARGYVTYVKQQIESSAALAERLNIKPMKVEMD